LMHEIAADVAEAVALSRQLSAMIAGIVAKNDRSGLAARASRELAPAAGVDPNSVREVSRTLGEELVRCAISVDQARRGDSTSLDLRLISPSVAEPRLARFTEVTGQPETTGDAE
jgi:hypothetical protein